MLKTAITSLITTTTVACATPTHQPEGAAPSILLQGLTNDAGIDCGELCSPSDVHVVEFPRLVSYNFDEVRSLDFQAVAGTALVTVDAWGNFGGSPSAPIFPDGLEIGIGGQPSCLSQDRIGDERGCESICTVTVVTVDGFNSVPLTLHQWNGDDGWSADTMVATITLQ